MNNGGLINSVDYEPTNNIIYCNWASTSGKKIYSSSAVESNIFSRTPFGKNINEELRLYIKRYFNVPDNYSILFGSGATDLLNKILLGLLFFKKGNVLTSILEHNSILRPLNYLTKWFGTDIKFITPDAKAIIDIKDVKSQIDSDTRLMVINHCSNITGICQPIDSLSDLLHENDIPLIVDCAQSGGFLDIDIAKLKADAFVFSAHKHFSGPDGFGFAIIKNDLPVQPIFSGGTGIESERLYQPEELPMRLECGTPNYEGMTNLLSSLKVINSKKHRDTLLNLMSMFHRFVGELRSIKGLKIIGTPEEAKIPIVNILINDFTSEELSYILFNVYSIVSRSGLHCAPETHKFLKTYPHGTVRLSFGYSTEWSEFEKVIIALKEISKGSYEL